MYGLCRVRSVFQGHPVKLSLVHVSATVLVLPHPLCSGSLKGAVISKRVVLLRNVNPRLRFCSASTSSARGS